MKIIGIVGKSNTGKTMLIEKLLKELNRRGISVAVIKSCFGGFSLDWKGKDSWKFKEAGAGGVALISFSELAVIRKREGYPRAVMLADKFFSDMDVVLMEGGKGEPGYKKIELLRKGVSEKIESSLPELAAVVSDFSVEIDRPVFSPEAIKEIADFLENFPDRKKPRAILEIDGRHIPIKQFVQDFIAETVLGMMQALKKIPPETNKITLEIRKENNLQRVTSFPDKNKT